MAARERGEEKPEHRSADNPVRSPWFAAVQADKNVRAPFAVGHADRIVRARAPVEAYTQRGESPRQAERLPACNRRLLRRGNTGWGAAGGEQPVRNNVINTT